MQFPVRQAAYPPLAVGPEHLELVHPVVAQARLVARQPVARAPDSLAQPQAAAGSAVAAVVDRAAAAAVEQTHPRR